MVIQVVVIALACAAWGAAVATGRGGVRLSLLVGALGFGIASAAFAGWVPSDFSTVGLLIAAIAGGVAAGRERGQWEWPWRRRSA